MRRRRIALRIVLITMVGLLLVGGTVGLLIFKPGIVLHTSDPVTTGGDASVTVGATIPEISGVNYDGNPVVVRAGTPTVLLFVAHWCEYCKQEMAQLGSDGAAEIPSGVRLVIISTRHIPFVSWPPKEALGLDGVPADVIVDTDSSLARRFGMTVTPTWFFVDSTGKVERVEVGVLGRDELTEIVSSL